MQAGSNGGKPPSDWNDWSRSVFSSQVTAASSPALAAGSGGRTAEPERIREAVVTALGIDQAELKPVLNRLFQKIRHDGGFAAGRWSGDQDARSARTHK